jgi:hypothetical protein
MCGPDSVCVSKEQYDYLVGLIDSLQAINANATANVPSCSNSNFDSGNTAWILVATALVLLMTLPGVSKLSSSAL